MPSSKSIVYLNCSLTWIPGFDLFSTHYTQHNQSIHSFFDLIFTLQYTNHRAVVPLRDFMNKSLIKEMTSSMQVRSEFSIFGWIYNHYGYACLVDLLYTFIVLALFYFVFDPWKIAKTGVVNLYAQLHGYTVGDNH